MPTQRKRIGFLPRSEVQNVIDKICSHNRLSQSKVTGLLVEEALCSRGVLKTNYEELSFDFISNNSETKVSSNESINNIIPTDAESFNLDDLSINDEVQMINDFIQFKFFKKIMNRKKR